MVKKVGFTPFGERGSGGFLQEAPLGGRVALFWGGGGPENGGGWGGGVAAWEGEGAFSGRQKLNFSGAGQIFF